MNYGLLTFLVSGLASMATLSPNKELKNFSFIAISITVISVLFNLAGKKAV